MKAQSPNTGGLIPTFRMAVSIGIASILLALPAPSHAGLFACMDAQGITVITDRPTQLSQCHPLSEPPAQESSVPSPRSHSAIAPSQALPAPSALPERSGTWPVETPAQASIISAPLERIGPLFVVNIVVNDTRPARLILDTGASHTILSRAIARDLGLWSQQSSTSVTMQTVGGTVQADLLQIDSIRIGGADVRQSIAAIHDLPDAPPDIEGLLGLSVLRHFAVTIDAPRNRLLLEPVQP